MGVLAVSALASVGLTPEDCEVFARAQDAERRAHLDAAEQAVQRARRCEENASAWRSKGDRIRANERKSGHE
jgi:hypothetical protein